MVWLWDMWDFLTLWEWNKKCDIWRRRRRAAAVHTLWARIKKNQKNLETLCEQHSFFTLNIVFFGGGWRYETIGSFIDICCAIYLVMLCLIGCHAIKTEPTSHPMIKLLSPFLTYGLWDLFCDVSYCLLFSSFTICIGTNQIILILMEYKPGGQ